MPSAQTSLAALLLLLALVSEASALFEKKTFDSGIFAYPSHRTDLCNIAKKYAPRQLNYAPRQHNPVSAWLCLSICLSRCTSSQEVFPARTPGANPLPRRFPSAPADRRRGGAG